MAQALPEWSDVKVSTCSRYFGFMTGPGKAEQSWSKATMKYPALNIRSFGAICARPYVLAPYVLAPYVSKICASHMCQKSTCRGAVAPAA